MKNNLRKILSLAVLFIVVPIFFGSVNAASLKFDKTTVSGTNGGTFQIAVTVDPGSDPVLSTDVYVTFDSSLLKANSVAAGTLFPVVTNDISTSGKVYIAGMVSDTASPVTTSGTLATITFQALKDGTGTLAFDCNTSTIVKNDVDTSNILVCSQNNSSVVTIGSGGGGSSNNTTTDNTPTDTPVQDNVAADTAAANSDAPAELPRTGIFENVSKIAVPGMLLLIVGGIFRLLL